VGDLLELVCLERSRREGLATLKSACEGDLMAFVRGFWHVLEPPSRPLLEGWVLWTLADVLMAATDGHVRRAIINVFPGAMKSLLLTVFWPAWEWGPCGMPEMRYISASYNTQIPEDNNRKFMKLVTSVEYQRLWPIELDQVYGS
jgi:hypothetical protein